MLKLENFCSAKFEYLFFSFILTKKQSEIISGIQPVDPRNNLIFKYGHLNKDPAKD
jgi:hypothetical protein